MNIFHWVVFKFNYTHHDKPNQAAMLVNDDAVETK